MHFHMCKMGTAFLVLQPVLELNVHPKDSGEGPWKRPSHRFCSEGRRLEAGHLLTAGHARPLQGQHGQTPPRPRSPPQARGTPGSSRHPRPCHCLLSSDEHAPFSASPSTPNLQGNPATEICPVWPPDPAARVCPGLYCPPHPAGAKGGPVVSVSIIYPDRGKAAGTGPCRMTGRAVM